MWLNRLLGARSRLRVALIALVLLAAPRAAGATVCGSTVRVARANGADAVFLGVVESSRPSFRHPLTQVVTSMRVLRAWEGIETPRVDLTWDIDERWMGASAFWSTLRGDALRGDTVLVAAWRKDGALTSTTCTYWRERAAEREMSLLGPGARPAVVASVVHVGLWWPWPALVGVVLLVTAAILGARRRAS